VDRAVIAVSVSYSDKESVERLRRMLSEVEQLCLSFDSSVELAEFLRSISAARYAFERFMEVKERG